jgi:signal transduction histidine kinase
VYLLIATGTFFPLLVLAAAGAFWLRALDARMLEGRVAAVSTVAAHFDAELTDDLEALQRLASSVSGELGGAALAAERAAIVDVSHYFRHRGPVYLVDRAKQVVAEEPPSGGLPASALPLVDEVLATGRPRVSELFVDERGRLVHELVAVRRWDGGINGVVVGSFDPRRRDFARMLQQVKQGAAAVADLVDGSGRVIASTQPDRAGERWDCGGIAESVHERRSFAERCSECHWRRGVDPASADLVTFIPLSAAPWAVVVRQPAGEVLPTEGAISWTGVVAVLLLHLGLTTVFAWGAARSVTRPVAVLTREAERIAGGELAAPIPPLGGDEIGRLGRSLDVMRESLRRINEDLEQRVEDRTRALEEANRQLIEREAARGELLRKVITAQEDERKRIARELHDETTQSLAVLAMGLESAMEAIRAGKTPHLDEVKAVAVKILEDVHRLILDLRPSVLDDLGLASAIRWYAERTLQSRGVSVRCEFGDLPRLAPEVETALFRMCQEAISNVARHAQATAVLVQVGAEGGEVVIELEDDGKGFDLAKVGEGRARRPWGLMGIRERAEILGGTATVESAPGQGTRVLVHIPVPKEQP